jgi:hypothetical protein
MVERSKLGIAWSSNPRVNTTAARRTTLPTRLPRGSEASRRGPRARGMATPTMNRKNGKMRSVGVQPCQSAWRRGPYTARQVPGLLTSTMPATVRPRKTSSDRSRDCAMPSGYRCLAPPTGPRGAPERTYPRMRGHSVRHSATRASISRSPYVSRSPHVGAAAIAAGSDHGDWSLVLAQAAGHHREQRHPTALFIVTRIPGDPVQPDLETSAIGALSVAGGSQGEAPRRSHRWRRSPERAGMAQFQAPAWRSE